MYLHAEVIEIIAIYIILYTRAICLCVCVLIVHMGKLRPR